MLSPTIIDHFYNPRNSGSLDEATHKGVAGSPGDGPYVILHFHVESGVIRAARYETYGCPVVVTCASIVAELFQGKTVEQAWRLEQSDLELLCGGIPEGKSYCPELTIKALRDALSSEGQEKIVGQEASHA